MPDATPTTAAAPAAPAAPVAAPAPAAGPATSENFMTAVRSNAATIEGAPARGANDIETQFGETPDVPFDEPMAEPAVEGTEGTEALDAQTTPEDDGFVDAEVIDLDAEIHGVKARDLLAAIKAGTVPPDVAAKLGLTAPALDEVFFAEGDFPGMKGAEVLEALRTGAVLTNDALRKIPVSVKVDGKELIVSAREAGDGYQRLSDTSRKNKLIADQKAQLDYRDRTFNEMTEAWAKDGKIARQGAKLFKFLPALEAEIFAGFDKPESLRQTLTRRGYGEALFEVARSITREQIELHEMEFNPDGTPNPRGKAIADRLRQEQKNREAMDRDLWMKDEQLKDEADERARRQRMQQRRQQQQQQAPGNNETTQALMQRVEIAMPAALKAVGLKLVKDPATGRERVLAKHENTFAHELGEMIAAHRGPLDDGTLNQMIRNAAQITREAEDDEGGGAPALPAATSPAAAQVAARAAAPAAAPAAPVQRAPAPNPSPLSPRPGATPTAPVAPAGLQRGGSSEDFGAYTATLKRGGRR